jgi:hypothetical protein
MQSVCYNELDPLGRRKTRGFDGMFDIAETYKLGLTPCFPLLYSLCSFFHHPTIMKPFISSFVLALAVGAFARVPRLYPRWEGSCPAGTCAFELSVNGGPVYENPTDAHQLAFGGSEPGQAVTFCISEEGQITDNEGICGITQDTDNDMETTQFQCDAGMSIYFASYDIDVFADNPNS